MHHRVLIILNPTSGARGRNRARRRLLRHARSRVRAAQCRVELALTQYPQHAAEIARQSLEDSYDLVIATGGDGTVNEVASCLAGTGRLMGIVPMGSGNGLARHLDIPLHPALAFNLAAEGQEIAMDCGVIDGRRFFTTAGLGFDAEVGWMFSSLGKRGLKSYVQATVQLYLHYKPRWYTLEVDGQTMRRQALMITLANASQFGNNARIAPMARVNDGQLELVVVHPFPKWAIGYLASFLFQGLVHRSIYVETIPFRRLRIEVSEPVKGHVDGEPVSLPARIEAYVQPASLRMVAGPGAPEISGRQHPMLLASHQHLQQLVGVANVNRRLNRFVRRMLKG